MLQLNPYASFIDNRSVAEILTTTPDTIATLTQSADPARLTHSPAPGKWSVAEILAHLADCEIAFSFRLRQTLAEDHHIMQPFDQDLWARAYTGISAAEALATFTALRRWNLLLLRNAPTGSSDKIVSHPERGTMTFATIVETMAGHDLNHLAQIKSLL